MWALGGLKCGLHPCTTQVSILPSDTGRVVTFFLEPFQCSGPKIFVAMAKGFGAHMGGHESVFHHALSSGQQAFQKMGRTGGSVARALLGRDAGLQDGGKGACQ